MRVTMEDTTAICDLEFNNPSTPRNNRLLTDFRGDELLQNVKDWFCNIKNQIHERIFGQTTTTTMPFLTIEMFDLDRFELIRRLRNHEWHLLNISTLSFDSNQDWGFSVGNWYFIKKGFKHQDEFEETSNEFKFESSSTIHPKESTQAETGETFNMTNDPEVTEYSPTTLFTTALTMHNVTSLMTQHTDSQTTIGITEPIDLSENFSSEINGSLEDNETDNDVQVGSSVEVLMG
ncbi:hypothetical protein WN48_02171 [Eufriesea mexicana]|uniref:Uncharacterized protein n=1 Tax=Eufriesea mexicana TaxID=516756 RepID=A0A310SC62_9HYME|nr:hypothetical protein WN48_02171 [Eufriesea mexicana]